MAALAALQVLRGALAGCFRSTETFFLPCSMKQCFIHTWVCTLTVSAILSPLQLSAHTPNLRVCVCVCVLRIRGATTGSMAHYVWHDRVDSAHSVNKDKSAHTHTTINSWNPTQGHCIQMGVPRDMCWAPCPALTALSKSEEVTVQGRYLQSNSECAKKSTHYIFFLICSKNK